LFHDDGYILCVGGVLFNAGVASDTLFQSHLDHFCLEGDDKKFNDLFLPFLEHLRNVYRENEYTEIYDDMFTFYFSSYNTAVDLTL